MPVTDLPILDALAKITPVAPEKRLRIRLPQEGFNVSGGIRVVTQIANGLAARGHEVTLIVPDYQATTPFTLHPDLRIGILPTKRRGLLRKIEYVLKLTKVAARDCDICAGTSSRTTLYIALSLLRTWNRPKLVYLVQHYEVWSHAEQTARPWLFRKFLALSIKIGYGLPFHQVAVSQWARDMIGKPDCIVISNGVDIAAFQPAESSRPAGKFVIGVIESDVPWKGYALFLEAMRLLADATKSDMRVKIASREMVALPVGIESERLKPQGDREMAEFYHGCDVFVFTSTTEGFGLPPLEAMACGVPVITTDCGGVRDYANDTNAIITPPGAVEELMEAILEVKNDAARREQLRQAGLETARNHSLAAMLQAHIDFMESL